VVHALQLLVLERHYPRLQKCTVSWSQSLQDFAPPCARISGLRHSTQDTGRAGSNTRRRKDTSARARRICWKHDQVHGFQLAAAVAEGREALHVEHLVPRALLQVELFEVVALLPDLRQDALWQHAPAKA
jgi:hypothetical protein